MSVPNPTLSNPLTNVAARFCRAESTLDAPAERFERLVWEFADGELERFERWSADAEFLREGHLRLFDRTLWTREADEFDQNEVIESRTLGESHYRPVDISGPLLALDEQVLEDAESSELDTSLLPVFE